MSCAYHSFRQTGGKDAERPAADGKRQVYSVQRGYYIALLGAGLLSLIVTACGGTRAIAPDATQIEGFRAGIVADEPRAALIGRNVMAAGGNAADGVVAAYFAMSVTMPSVAGLGGGGVCIAHKAEREATDVIDFLPRAAAGGSVAVPGNVRGMAALNARYGSQPMSGLIAPAENLAGIGFPVSRALAREIAPQDERLHEDPALAALFSRLDGSLAGEGDVVRQADLAASLAQLRVKGVNEFYSGLLGQKLAEAAQSIGAPLTIEDLRNFKVGIYPPLEAPFTDISLYLAQPPASGGVLTGQAIAALGGGDNGADAQARIARELMLARAQWMKPGGDSNVPAADLLARDKARALAAQGGVPMTMVENPSAASVVAVDSDGNGVACTFTMNAPFGAARLALGTGIVLSPAPNDAGIGFSALSPVMVASKYNGELYFASGAAGGAAGALAEALVLDAVMRRSMPLDQAMQLPRAFDGGSPDQVYREESGGTLSLGRVNAIFCSRGTPGNPDSCQIRNDYRGSGLATILGQE